MKLTPRLLNQLSSVHPTKPISRANTTAFIGLGRMGFEMAYNLFSHTLVDSDGSANFVVCDAREESAITFARNLVNQFPGARVEVVNTPAE